MNEKSTKHVLQVPEGICSATEMIYHYHQLDNFQNHLVYAPLDISGRLGE